MTQLERRPKGSCLRAPAWLCIVVAALFASKAHAQQVISGSVLEKGTGKPVSGARVSIAGAAADTTLADGSFRVTVSAREATVRVTKLGFAPATRRVTLQGRASVSETFELEKRVLGLDAVVVTGTAGATQVREVGHTVAEIRPANLPEPILSMDHLLAGKVPGLQVIPGTGLAGSGAKIRLRGSSSVSLSNQPLVYVDGVRIRSDAYPKNAPFNDRLRSNNDTPSPIDDIDPADVERVEIVKGPAATTLYGTEAAPGVIQIFTKRGTAGRTIWNYQLDLGTSSVRPFGPDDEPYLRLDPWLKNATSAGYSLSLSGGGAARYHLGTSFHRNEGVLPDDMEKRVSVRGNFDVAPLRNLTLAWSSAISIDRLKNTPAGPNSHGLTQNAFRGPANATGIDTKESLDRVLAWDISTNLNHAIGGLTAVWTPVPSMSHTVTLGYDRAESEMRSLRPYGFVFVPQGSLSVERWLSSTSTVDYLGRWRFDINKAAGLTVAWGGQSIDTDISSVAGLAEGFAGPAPPTLSSGATTLASENRTQSVIAGAFAQTTFDFSNRLFLTAGLRIDGSSSFGDDFGLQPFPRFSASYVVSDEKFWPRSFGILRLRAAYGHAGRAPRVFDADRTWIGASYDGKPAYLPQSIGNPDLGPERSVEKEIGFDASRSDDRLRASLSFYRRDTHDALLPVTYPASLGFLNPQLSNVGGIRASGMELSLNASLGSQQGFSLDAGVDLSLNRTKVTRLGDLAPFALQEVAWIKQGYPAPVIIGTYVKNPDAIAAPEVESNHVFGPNMPTRIIGLHSTIGLWKGISVSARAEYQGGNYLSDNASSSLLRQGVHPLCYSAAANLKDSHPERLTAWERFWCTSTKVPTDGPIVRGDFMRLRDLSVTVPLRASFWRARNATATIAARNYLIWKNSDLRAWDPEMGGRDGIDAPVRQIESSVPPTASISLSIRATYW